MSPGGGFCKEAVEPGIVSSASDLLPTSNAYLRSSTNREASPASGGNLRSRSNHDVHELLECPVCVDLKHDTIYQVCLLRFLPWSLNNLRHIPSLYNSQHFLL